LVEEVGIGGGFRLRPSSSSPSSASSPWSSRRAEEAAEWEGAGAWWAGRMRRKRRTESRTERRRRKRERKARSSAWKSGKRRGELEGVGELGATRLVMLAGKVRDASGEGCSGRGGGGVAAGKKG
jgi:hypothetical protein